MVFDCFYSFELYFAVVVVVVESELEFELDL